MSALGQKRTWDCPLIDVRFTPKSGHRSARWQCLLCAKSGLNAPQQKRQNFLSNAFKEIAPFRAELPSPTASHEADLPIQR
jgi:hypothetical protein